MTAQYVVCNTTGFHTVKIEHLSGNFSVVNPPPLIPKFIVSDFILSKLTVDPSEELNGTVTIQNIGNSTGIHEINVIMDNKIIYEELIILQKYEIKFYRFILSSNITGLHAVYINGLMNTFNVTEKMMTSLFTLNNLTISPSNVTVGEFIEISVEITNIGTTVGVKNVTIQLNSNAVGSEYIELNSNESKQISFQILMTKIGNHTITISNVSECVSVSDIPIINDTMFIDENVVTIIGIALTLLIGLSIFFKRI